MKKNFITIMLSAIFILLPACGSSSSTSSDSSSNDSSGSTSEPYVGAWHIMIQTLLGGGGSPSGLVVMDLSDKNSQLMIRGESWIAIDNNPSSGCESVTLSVAYAADQTWTSVITANDGTCAYGDVGTTYTGSWAMDNSGNLTWTMDGLVNWFCEPV